MTFCDFCEKSAKKILKSLVLIRIKALNVKKGRPGLIFRDGGHLEGLAVFI